MKKKILIIVLILIIIFGIYFSRNLMIAKKHALALYQFRKESNHCYTIHFNSGAEWKMYYKDGKIKNETWVPDENDENGKNKLSFSTYGNSESSEQIMVIDDTQQFIIYENMILGFNGNIAYNYTFYELDPEFKDNEELKWYHNLLMYVVYALSPVISKEYNGIDCYEINNCFGLTFIAKIYIDKETYLPVASVNNSEIETYKFEVGNVTDEDVTVPDLSGYAQIIQGEN